MSQPGQLRSVGDVVELSVDAVAHGGHCVARHDGRVVFVRHALPGERVLVRLTECSDDARFWRGEAIEVVVASPDRVVPRCPVSGPGGCGGCDFQHVDLAAQRRLKATVVAEQLRRLAGIDMGPDDIEVEAADPADDGLGWRTRMRLAVDAHGRAGLRAHRSHDVVALEDCPLAQPSLDLPAVLARRWPVEVEVSVVGGDGREPTVQTVRGRRSDPVSGPARRREKAAGRTWQVSGAGFWQVHPRAADVLVAAVREALEPAAGDTLLDLYSGVGLFAGALADALGPSGSAVAVELDSAALRDARRNLHDLPGVRLVQARVDRFLRSDDAPAAVDIVVLDPPRSGAGREVCAAIAERGPRSVAYVACDPAALARDVATFDALGYELASLRAFDAFPMTHHVECVATLRPRSSRGRMVADDERGA